MCEKIVIVDDDKDYREIASLALMMEDFDVEGKSSGKEFLDCLERETPDLVLLDRRMPGMNGIEVLEEIQKREYDVDVALLTALDQDVDPEEVGAVAYIEKVDVRTQDVFVGKIKNLLESRKNSVKD